MLGRHCGGADLTLVLVLLLDILIEKSENNKEFKESLHKFDSWESLCQEEV